MTIPYDNNYFKGPQPSADMTNADAESDVQTDVQTIDVNGMYLDGDGASDKITIKIQETVDPQKVQVDVYTSLSTDHFSSYRHRTDTLMIGERSSQVTWSVGGDKMADARLMLTGQSGKSVEAARLFDLLPYENRKAVSLNRGENLSQVESDKKIVEDTAIVGVILHDPDFKRLLETNLDPEMMGPPSGTMIAPKPIEMYHPRPDMSPGKAEGLNGQGTVSKKGDE